LNDALLERDENERKRAAAFERIGKNIGTAGTNLRSTVAHIESAAPAFAILRGYRQRVKTAATDHQQTRSVGHLIESAGAAIIRAVPQIAGAVERIEVITLARIEAERHAAERLKQQEKAGIRAGTLARIGSNIQLAGIDFSLADTNLGKVSSAFSNLPDARERIAKRATDYQLTRSAGHLIESIGAALVRVIPKIAHAVPQIEIVADRFAAARLVYDQQEAEFSAAVQRSEDQRAERDAERESADHATPEVYEWRLGC
jgi:hypothetical protein